MKLSTSGRRMFLCGAGATLAVPFLRSLLPRGVAQSSEWPVRYIQVVNSYGPTEGLFFGTRTPNMRVAPNVNVQRLTEIEGKISAIFDTNFDPFKSKMSLIRGIDTLARTTNHHSCFSTCASSYEPNLDGDRNPPASGQPSIDSILANSSKSYPGAVPAARRLVVLNPTTTEDYTRGRSWSWVPSAAGGLSMAPTIQETNALFDAFASGFGENGSADPREAALMSAVYDDFRKVRDGARISNEDRARLDRYMGLISDISQGAASCAAPDRLPDGDDVELRIMNQFNILAAAMACDLTRVASITLGMSEGYGVRHDQHHHLLEFEGRGEVTGLRTDFIRIGDRIARLLGVLDEISEGSGTLLDNAIVYYSMQYGVVLPAGQHNAEDMAIMVAGGAGGALTQGNYIDLRREVGGEVTTQSRRGVPINNLLVTLMNAMGLSSSDYEMPGRIGYGDYPGMAVTSAHRPDVDHWSSIEGKRSPLPVLYSGPTRS